MRGRGEEILEYLVKRADGAQDVAAIAKEVGARDGRSVANPVRDLVKAGLIQRTGGSRDLYFPTGRGREVDAILDRITVARGGRFMGTWQAGILWQESYALRR